eukprot:5071494-Alexandrium_andersonii.AAC.1
MTACSWPRRPGGRPAVPRQRPATNHEPSPCWLPPCCLPSERAQDTSMHTAFPASLPIWSLQ